MQSLVGARAQRMEKFQEGAALAAKTVVDYAIPYYYLSAGDECNRFAFRHRHFSLTLYTYGIPLPSMWSPHFGQADFFIFTVVNVKPNLSMSNSPHEGQ